VAIVVIPGEVPFALTAATPAVKPSSPVSTVVAHVVRLAYEVEARMKWDVRVFACLRSGADSDYLLHVEGGVLGGDKVHHAVELRSCFVLNYHRQVSHSGFASVGVDERLEFVVMAVNEEAWDVIVAIEFPESALELVSPERRMSVSLD